MQPLAPDSPTFEIRQCLGAGGFGEVYLAQLDGVGEVALKVLHNGLDPRSQAVQRLKDEARLLALLDHPSILRIHDLFLLEGRVALVTEYVDGEDLEGLLVARPGIAVPAGLEALSHVASALQTAYTTVGPRGEPLRLLHRDIKPGNIRIGRDGSVKLLDFGIAKATGVTREAKTRTSGVLGSFAYMAPERFDPKQEDTPAGDVCSLGCVLYELLSGGEMLFEDYDIKDLFGLALVEGRRDTALQERLAALEHAPPSLLELLREMLAYDAADRPELPDLSDRLDTLAGEVSGLRLRPWAAQYGWPAAPHLPGGLTGKSLSGASIGTRSQSIPPPSPEKIGSLTGQTFQSESLQLASGAPPPPSLDTIDPDDTGLVLDDRSDGGPDSTSLDSLDSLDSSRGPGIDPAVSTAIPIDPPAADDLVEKESRTGRIALFAGLALLVVGLSVGGGIAVAGLGVYLGGLPSGSDVVDPVDAGDPVAGVEPTADPQPDPPQPAADPSPGSEPTPPVPTPVPEGTPVSTPSPQPGSRPAPTPDSTPEPSAVPTPVPGALPSNPVGATDATADAGSPPGGTTSLDDCGGRMAVELAAQQGILSDPQRECLTSGMRNTGLKQTQRQAFARNLLIHLDALCSNGSSCAGFEDTQREYFRDLGRSDPDMMGNFAEYLYRSASDQPARLAEVDTWATRALERKDEWSGATYRRRTLEMHRLRGLAAYRRFELDRSESNRDVAFQRTAEWAEVLNRFNADASQAMDLCASAIGSRDRCDRRVSTEAATVELRFLSLPLGATVHVDGKDLGKTPLEVPLVHGTHTIQMKLDGLRSEKTITVGAGEAIQWQWRTEGDAWVAAY